MKISYKRTDLCVPNSLPVITVTVNCRRARRAYKTALSQLYKVNDEYWAKVAIAQRFSARRGFEDFNKISSGTHPLIKDVHNRRERIISRFQECKWIVNAMPEGGDW